MGQSPEVVRHTWSQASSFSLTPIESWNLTKGFYFLFMYRDRLSTLEQELLTLCFHLRAEIFALQISGYSKAVKGFVRDSDQAAKLIWAAASALLEARFLVAFLVFVLMQHSSARVTPKPLTRPLPSFMSSDYPFRASCTTTSSSMPTNTSEWRSGRHSTTC